ncbi:MAG TPA: DUF1634 domain-containing protein [Longimicrobiales bacterium]|nr:DUF1634 domain-containing protein [Longimicrobiales bacterium]
MAAFSRRWTEEQMEQWIGGLLRWGVIVAAAVAGLGAALFVTRHGSMLADFREFRRVPPGLDSVRGVVAGVLALDSLAIIQLGLLLLIATPIARVAMSLVAFVLQRDRTYVIITTVVLALLMYSLLGPGV